ncbi:MAG: ATP-binding protein [Bdellovibrionales bacterium]|nr:ATP-binding protein [Bdellovibrionales bacterium]
MSILLRNSFKDNIIKDLQSKMVFLGGPRQVGKTTLAQMLIKKYKDGHPAYLNWDNSLHRKKILNQDWPANEKLIIFDEIHKFKNWRNLVKGYYDTLKNTHQFLITGSARLDYYRKGGDSLLGRYHYHRLHPLSYSEIKKSYSLEQLVKFGGFPEPFLKKDLEELNRWHLQRRERVVYSDIRDLENIKEISMLDVLIEALPERVGSPLSRKSLGEDIQVDQKTIERWLQILERVYYCFRIPPFGAPKIRAVKKEQKLYLWDWSEHTDQGKKWENFIASQLLKYCHHHEDNFGEKMELRFIRDTDRREVDFVIIKNKKPLFAVECKTGEQDLSPHIRYFFERTKIPHFYQIHRGKKHKNISDNITVLPFEKFSEIVDLP